jgi:RNA polymerase sigma-32 factor
MTTTVSNKPLNLGVTANLGSIDSYMNAALRIAHLTRDEEFALSAKWRNDQDHTALQALVESHMALVIPIARKYIGYQIPMADLVQEGNIGLIKAAERFDVSFGFRFTSYAIQWIKSEIHEYILKNMRMVKIANTKPQRKLLYNLKLNDDKTSFTNAQVSAIATSLDVPEHDVRDMELRMTGSQFSLDTWSHSNGNDPSESFEHECLAVTNTEPNEVIQTGMCRAIHHERLLDAIMELDARSRRVVEARWLSNDDGSGATLHTLSEEFGVSGERIRQIEVAALKKLKVVLAPYKDALDFA